MNNKVKRNGTKAVIAVAVVSIVVALCCAIDWASEKLVETMSKGFRWANRKFPDETNKEGQQG